MYEIIDFHTHPFQNEIGNICQHKAFLDMGASQTLALMDNLNVKYFCGSVIRTRKTVTEHDLLLSMLEKNEQALKLQKYYMGRYIAGFHVHPSFVKESVSEIEKMAKQGVKLIGELVPYIDKWQQGYKGEGFYDILSCAQSHNMIVSFHSSGYDFDEIDQMVKNFPDIKFVGAHPDEGEALLRHIERLKKFDNYYLDLSGNGLFREGMLRRIIDQAGVDKLLFGSDFPVCNLAMFVGGVLLDDKITPAEKEKIFYLNAKKLLNI